MVGTHRTARAGRAEGRDQRPPATVARSTVASSVDLPPQGRRYRPMRSGRFDEVRRKGRHVRRGGLVLIVAPGTPGAPEVGVVAGRRVGNAVRRNRAKRRLRAAADAVSLRPDTAYVLIASPEVVDAPFDRLVEWLRKAVDASNR